MITENDLEFFTRTLGYNFYLKLEDRIKLIIKETGKKIELQKLKYTASYYDYENKNNLSVVGIMSIDDELAEFTASYKQSIHWDFPSRSIYTLYSIWVKYLNSDKSEYLYHENI